MPKIEIKVKKEASFIKRNSNHLDLRKVASLNQKQPRRKRLFLVFLILVIFILLIKILFFSPQEEVSLNRLIPQQAAILSLIQERALVEEINYPFNQETLNKFNGYLSQADLDWSQDILPLFKKPVAFASFPQSDASQFFVLLFQLEVSPDKIKAILKSLERVLKNDYQFSYQIYRQTKIVILKPLIPDSSLYYYSQIEDYLIISNSLEWIEKVIDLIIQK